MKIWLVLIFISNFAGILLSMEAKPQNFLTQKRARDFDSSHEQDAKRKKNDNHASIPSVCNLEAYMLSTNSADLIGKRVEMPEKISTPHKIELPRKIKKQFDELLEEGRHQEAFFSLATYFESEAGNATVLTENYKKALYYYEVVEDLSGDAAFEELRRKAVVAQKALFERQIKHFNRNTHKQVNYAEPKKIFSKSELLDAIDAYDLGSNYEFGDNSAEQDYKQSFAYYRIAARLGHGSALFKIGYFYEYGYGIECNKQKAIKFYNKAARRNDPEALFALAFQYEDQNDFKNAVKLYSQAAALGNLQAKTNLGILYEYGKGVEVDEKRAFQLYKQAADENHTDAQFYAGWCYQDGIGVDPDEDQAQVYFRRAADKGHEQAQKSLK